MRFAFLYNVNTLEQKPPSLLSNKASHNLLRERFSKNNTPALNGSSIFPYYRVPSAGVSYLCSTFWLTFFGRIFAQQFIVIEMWWLGAPF